jgi:hypothetical protein
MNWQKLMARRCNMAKAWAVLVGVLHMEDGTWASGSENAENDVDLMQEILTGFGKIVPLKTAGATRDSVLGVLGTAAASLTKDDLFVFYYAGHGLPGSDGHTRHLIVLYNELLDTAELGKIWCHFRPDVRIVMISESCNSGTDYRKYLTSLNLNLEEALEESAHNPIEEIGVGDIAKPDRGAPRAGDAQGPRGQDRSAGGSLKLGPISPFRDDTQAAGMQAQMIHFGATADDEDAVGGEFTSELLKVWKRDSFKNYRQLFCQTLALVKASIYKDFQFPEYRPYGPVSTGFEDQKPFTIEPPPPGNLVTKAVLNLRDCY